MKLRLLYILPAILFALAAHAENTDTTIVISTARQVVITESPEQLKVRILGNEDNPDFDSTIVKKYTREFTVKSSVSRLTESGVSLTGRKTKNNDWDFVSGGLLFGFCATTDVVGGAATEMGKSFEISWMNITALEYSCRNHFGVSLGVGIDWRNFRTTLGQRFTIDKGNVAAEEFDDDVTPKLSRIKIFSVIFPLLWRQQIPFTNSNKKMNIQFGPIFSINTHGSLLSTWTLDNGKSAKSSINNINLRKFTIDLYAKVSLGSSVGVYVKYSPYKMFNGQDAYNFHPLSTGLVFFM